MLKLLLVIGAALYVIGRFSSESGGNSSDEYLDAHNDDGPDPSELWDNYSGDPEEFEP